MYAAFYRLREKPFQITSDPRFVWMGANHRAALDFLKAATAAKTRLILLTGDVGTGKTTLIHCFAATLPAGTRTAVLVDPTIEVEAFYRFVHRAFGLAGRPGTPAETQQGLAAFVRENTLLGNDIVLIIDEAHRLSPALLKALESIGEVETPGMGRFFIILAGQDELDRLREEREYAWIQASQAAFFRLDPLDAPETAAYVRHRLKVAGAGAPVFTPAALKAVHRYTGGFPRLINILCDHALIEGYVSDQRRLGSEVIRKCAGQMPLLFQASPAPAGLAGMDPPPRPKPLERSASICESGGPSAEGDAHSGTGGKMVSGIVMACLFLILGSYLLATRLVDSAPRQTAPPPALRQPHNASPPAQFRPAASRQTAPDPAPRPESEAPQESRPPDGSRRIQTVSLDAAESSPPAVSPAQPASADDPPKTAPGTKPAAPVSLRQADGPPPGTRAPGRPFPPDEGAPLEDTEFVIHFPVGSHDLSPEALQLLDRIAAHSLRKPPRSILIIGYTDASGSYRKNVRLAEKRARAVKARLAAGGIAPSLLQSFGAGPVNPVASNRTPEGRKANRRVEIDLEYKGLDIGTPF